MGCGAGKGVKAIHPEPAADSIVPCDSGAIASSLGPVVASAAPAPSAVSGGATSSISAPVDDSNPKSVPATADRRPGDGNNPQGAAAAIPARPKAKAKAKASLIKAVKENNLPLIEELSSDGTRLEDLGMWDNTPLLAACTYGHTEAALMLIAKKANVWAKNEHDATPLHYASVEGSLHVVESLVAAARAQGGSAGVMKFVNCQPAKVYNRHLDAYARRLPLGSAAESGFPEVVSALLASSAQMEACGDDGRTPLWLACRHSKCEVVKLLLQNSADTGAKDASGTSVLQAATVLCNEELVLTLLRHGVGDVNDTVGSPLRDAVKAGKRAVVEALLTQGAAVHPKAPGGDGEGAPTAADKKIPLHAACEKGDEYVVQLLVKARADPSLSDAAGLTAFDLLRRRGLSDRQIVTLLSPPSSGLGEDGGTGGATCDNDLVSGANPEATD